MKSKLKHIAATATLSDHDRAVIREAIKSLITLPELAAGERYLCGTVNQDGSITHSILLPGDNEDASFEEQLAWAKSIGGDLLSRAELVTAYETMPEEFQKDWYWSSTQHVSDSAYAWYQYFYDGGQLYYGTRNKLRARAVRRLPI